MTEEFANLAVSCSPGLQLAVLLPEAVEWGYVPGIVTLNPLVSV